MSTALLILPCGFFGLRSQGHPLSDAEFDNAMKILDSDGNGKLGYDEFKAWWSTGSDRFEMLKQADEIEDEGYAAWMEAAVQHFRFFDADLSGEIDSTEFAQLYENLKGHGYPLGTVEEATAAMDADGDGHVNLTEYCGWLQKLRTGK